MKVGYLIIAIVLWSILPVVLLLGWLKLMPTGSYGSLSGAYFCIAIPGVIAIIIGTVFFIMGLKETPAKEGNIQINKPNRKCPNCGKTIRLDVRKCPNCGKNF